MIFSCKHFSNKIRRKLFHKTSSKTRFTIPSVKFPSTNFLFCIVDFVLRRNEFFNPCENLLVVFSKLIAVRYRQRRGYLPIVLIVFLVLLFCIAPILLVCVLAYKKFPLLTVSSLCILSFICDNCFLFPQTRVFADSFIVEKSRSIFSMCVY